MTQKIAGIDPVAVAEMFTHAPNDMKNWRLASLVLGERLSEVTTELVVDLIDVFSSIRVAAGTPAEGAKAILLSVLSGLRQKEMRRRENEAVDEKLKQLGKIVKEIAVAASKKLTVRPEELAVDLRRSKLQISRALTTMVLRGLIEPPNPAIPVELQPGGGGGRYRLLPRGQRLAELVVANT